MNNQETQPVNPADSLRKSLHDIFELASRQKSNRQCATDEGLCATAKSAVTVIRTALDNMRSKAEELTKEKAALRNALYSHVQYPSYGEAWERYGKLTAAIDDLRRQTSQCWSMRDMTGYVNSVDFFFGTFPPSNRTYHTATVTFTERERDAMLRVISIQLEGQPVLGDDLALAKDVMRSLLAKRPSSTAGASPHGLPAAPNP